MVCRLFGARPLSEPMLEYCQLDPWEHKSVIFFIEVHIYSIKKMHLEMVSAKWRSFCLGINVLTGIETALQNLWDFVVIPMPIIQLEREDGFTLKIV